MVYTHTTNMCKILKTLTNLLWIKAFQEDIVMKEEGIKCTIDFLMFVEDDDILVTQKGGLGKEVKFTLASHVSLWTFKSKLEGSYKGSL